MSSLRMSFPVWSRASSQEPLALTETPERFLLMAIIKAEEFGQTVAILVTVTLPVTTETNQLDIAAVSRRRATARDALSEVTA